MCFQILSEGFKGNFEFKKMFAIIASFLSTVTTYSKDFLVNNTYFLELIIVLVKDRYKVWLDLWVVVSLNCYMQRTLSYTTYCS